MYTKTYDYHIVLNLYDNHDANHMILMCGKFAYVRPTKVYIVSKLSYYSLLELLPLKGDKWQGFFCVFFFTVFSKYLENYNRQKEFFN